ncbi:hypothetical protein Gpo141_00000480 [Globisporangium polare]
MLTKTLAFTSALLVALLDHPGAQAHQMVILPTPTWTIEGKGQQWRPMAYLEGQSGFSPNPDFNGYLDSKGFKTMRDFMDDSKLYHPVSDADFKCGYTKLDGTPQPIPKNDMIRTTGYTHEGPCEIWLDDTRVFHGKNCHVDVGAGTNYQKLDFSSCKGKCTMYWYWLGIRGSGKSVSWQIYKECIPLIGNGGSSASAGAAATTAPAPTKKASAPATNSDKVGGEASNNANATAPAIPVSKCKVKST